MKAGHIRQRTINIPDTITNFQFNTLIDKFNDMESIIEFEMTDERLLIKYDLKGVCFNEIWLTMKGVLLRNQFDTFTWWKNNFIAQLEANEKDHLVNRFGWYEYVARIYVDHHLQYRDDANKKKLWQQYTDKDKSKAPE